MIKKWFSIMTLVSSLFISVVFAQKNDNFIKRTDVQQYIDELVTKHHFTRADMIDLFRQVQFPEKVITSVSKPAEEMTWERYRNLLVTEQNIHDGVSFWRKHQQHLERAQQLYGVPINLIVATIGIESRYGENAGKFRVIDSLTNLAFNYPRRAKFFKNELTEFLLLSRELNLDPLSLMGSYAGAIGQPQFMPSNYRRYAVDFSGMHHVDLVNNPVDVIGSIANFYSKHGWKKGEPIAVLATLPHQQQPYKVLPTNNHQDMTITTFKSYGIAPTQPVDDALKARIVMLDFANSSQIWLTFNNFSVIKKYNPSTFYAMAVHQLAQAITEEKQRQRGE